MDDPVSLIPGHIYHLIFPSKNEYLLLYQHPFKGVEEHGHCLKTLAYIKMSSGGFHKRDNWEFHLTSTDCEYSIKEVPQNQLPLYIDENWNLTEHFTKYLKRKALT